MNPRARRNAERVDSAHVREDVLAERVDVVEADVVVVGQARAITPDPAGGNARIVEIEDVVVFYAVVRRVADPDANRRGVQPAAVGDQAAADCVVRNDLFGITRRGVPGFFARPGGRADQHAAAAEIDQFAAIHQIVAAAPAKSHRVSADLPHGAAVEGDVPRGHGRNCRARLTSAWGKLWPCGGSVQLSWAKVRPRKTRWWT